MKYESIQKLFSDKTRWTTKSTARNNRGTPVYADQKSAVCFCLLGAIYHVYGYSDRGHNWGASSAGYEIIQKVNRVLLKSFRSRIYSSSGDEVINISRFNDDAMTTFEDVLSVVKAASV